MEASALYPDGRFMVEDLLDFTLGAGDEEDDDDETKTFKAPSSSSSNPSLQDPDDHHHQSLALPEFVEEEELEWLSNKDAFPAVETCLDINKDAFPAVETCLDILSGNPRIVPNHHGLLENSSSSSNNSNGSIITSCCAGRISVPVRYPVKARSKRRCKQRHGISEQWLWWSQAKAKKSRPELPPPPPPPPSATAAIGRRCMHCRAEKTPQWRAGPMGPKTLCNACGVRYKSGRLVPEYRPASSPTFSSLVHSNSHRKIIEMRRQKQLGGMVNEACGYRVG